MAGGAVGYQKFLGALNRKQLVFELGLRYGTQDDVANAAAATIRYQMAMGRRFVVVCDGFAADYQSTAVDDADGTRYGARLELQIKF